MTPLGITIFLRPLRQKQCLPIAWSSLPFLNTTLLSLSQSLNASFPRILTPAGTVTLVTLLLYSDRSLAPWFLVAILRACPVIYAMSLLNSTSETMVCASGLSPFLSIVYVITFVNTA